MDIFLIGAGAVVSALVMVILLIVLLLGHRAPWILVALGVSFGCFMVCGAVVWRAFSALAGM